MLLWRMGMGMAWYAQRIRLQDREDRAQLYDQLAMPHDVSFRK